ncbi:MAG TPA: HAMP domain-containing sensor histidine kinase [Conexibacter sp.]|jgi:signal transduction histidine kinase|nr:HAMP domain-containing sensor histidine kinase [Conexibacter sp.]
MTPAAPPSLSRSSSPRSLGRSLLVALVACAAGAAVVAIPYGWSAGVQTFWLVAAVAAVTLAGAHVAAARRAQLGGLGRQYAVAVGLAIGAMLVAVWVAVEAMFVSRHDALLITAMTAVGGVVAVRAGGLLMRGMLRDVEAVRDGLEAVGEGARDVQVVPGGRDELAELALAANAMIARLGEEERARDAADGARRSLVAAVSHDLRTPLASLRLLVESVEDGVATGGTRARYLREMRTHVAALSVLIDDLFELSRLEAGEISWSMHQVELGELVSETVAALRAQAAERGVAVAAELPPDGEALAARANAEKVQRVLFNLIVNAIRHTPEDGSVVVRARPVAGGDGVEIEVADDGAGVAAGERERVFEPFYRGGADGVARSSDGAGLGLAISRAIVEAHGGRIWLEPAVPRGTRVRFTLPAAA